MHDVESQSTEGKENQKLSDKCYRKMSCVLPGASVIHL
jgi:hypothetical protein